MNHQCGGKDFMAMHRHGFVRVATSTPRVRPADVSYNRDAILEEARRADAARVDLAVFPELCVSSYAIDDLHLQTALLDAAEAAVGDITAATADLAPVLLIGAPLRHSGRLYNCALAIARGRLLGVVPKSFLPNYREYYEKRWFAHGRNLVGQTIRVAGRDVPFGTDLIFEASDLGGFVFHMEICEDFWAAVPPSSAGALAGATILANLSASNITIGKSDERHLLCRSQSARAVAAYAYSAAGPGESTTDLAWDGQGVIYELGDLLAEFGALPAGAAALHRRRRHRPHPRRAHADADLQRHGRGGPAVLASLPPRPLRASAELRGHRPDPSDPPLSLRAKPQDASRPGLLRSLQHPGGGPAPALRGDERHAHGDRRLGRARLHARADRRRQGLRPARPAAHARSSASPCRASPPGRRPRATPGS